MKQLPNVELVMQILDVSGGRFEAFFLMNFYLMTFSGRICLS